MTDASLHTFHVCHAVFFPLPLKYYTTSQPVKAWKKSIPLVFSSPMADTSSWIGIHLLCSPLSNATHIFSRPVAAREGNNYNVRVISLNHQRLVSLDGCMPSMYEYSRVSSSWEHGATSSRLTLVSLVVVMAFSPLVMITRLPVVISATLSTRKWNSSVLLVLSLRTLCQFQNMMSVLLCFVLQYSTLGRMSFLAHSSNVFGVRGATVFTSAVYKHDKLFTNTKINKFSDHQMRLNCVKC